MAMPIDLGRSTAIVTGGARSLGRTIAITLARAGSTVLIADLNEQDARTLADEICAAGQRAIPIHLDVTDDESVKRCVEEAIRRVGHVDILVNNAGMFPPRLGLELRDDEFNRCFDVNVTSIWRLAQALVPQFRARGGGRIINIASIVGRRGSAIAPAYCASKAAVINLTQALAAALGSYKITVNAVCPGEIPATGMTNYARSLLPGTEFEARVSSHFQLPLAGPLTVEDIAHAVLFFASDYARHVTGQALNVDCGQFMN